MGIVALVIGRKDAKRMIKEFDWNSLIFLAGIFGVIYTLTSSGLLADFAQAVVAWVSDNPSILTGLPSVGFSWNIHVH